MRKLFYLVVSIVIFGLIISGCFFHVVPPLGQDGSIDIVKDGVSYKTNLIAGQHTAAGFITVSNDGENLFVTYETVDNWLINETHLYVGTIIPTNSAPGKFPYKREELGGVTTDTYEIPLEDLVVGPCDTIYIAAHAELVKGETEEAGWAKGVKIEPGKNWAMYFNYQVLPCGSEIPELTEAISQNIDLSIGGTIEVDDPESLINGVKLIIPPIPSKKERGKLIANITISYIDDPYSLKLPDNRGYLLPPVVINSDILFDAECILEIPYTEDILSNMGLSSNENIKVYYYNYYTSSWEEVSINKRNYKAKIDFEYMLELTLVIEEPNMTYACSTPSIILPFDPGFPQPGDLLYRLSNVEGIDGWIPGHVGIYVGEKAYDGVIPYNVIEALHGKSDGTIINKVMANYYNPISEFAGKFSATYMGATQPRQPEFNVLDSNQRKKVVWYAEEMVGKPYAWYETSHFYWGLARGELVKGLYVKGLYEDSYNCVGLAEAAYEFARVNGGVGLVTEEDEGNNCFVFLSGRTSPTCVLTPAEQFDKTEPAEGYTVSGWVIDSQGNGISGVTLNFELVIFVGNYTDSFDEVKTDSEGKWSNSESYNHKRLGREWKVTPQKDGYTFEPSTIKVKGDASDIDFTGTLVAPETYTITASAGPHGSISPSGDVTVNEGSDKLFTITPDAGYYIADVLVDGNSVGAVSSHTFTNVTKDHAISATFITSSRYPIQWSTAESNGWANPLGEGKDLITDIEFDYNSDIYLHKRGKRHVGVDIVTQDETQGETNVYAIADGTVDYVFTQDSWYDDRGILRNHSVIFIKHTNSENENFFAIYGHVFAKDGLKEDEDEDKVKVKAGEKIGVVKQSGTPCHLHFGINTFSNKDDFYYGIYGWGRIPADDDPSDYDWVDPIDYLNTHQTESVVSNVVAVYWTDHYPSNSQNIEHLINVFWDPYPEASGYKVYRSVNGVVETEPVYTGPGELLYDKNVVQWHDFSNIVVGNSYSYYVTAYGDGWETAPSQETGTINTFLPPIYLVSPSDGGTINNSTPTFEWSPVGANPGGSINSGITELWVKDLTDNKVTWDILINDMTTSNATYNQDEQASPLIPGHSYAWEVTSYGSIDNMEVSISQSEYWEFTFSTDDIVIFEDPNLEQAVRETINKPEGPLYLSDVIGIRFFSSGINYRGIESLEGIQHLQNLEGLQFYGNKVSDISPLKNLTNLKSLNFDDNQVSDISPLENLTNLEWLACRNNKVSDISPLENLTNLNGLYFPYNQVMDISPLKNMTNLNRLDLTNNQVSDISPLENLTTLEWLYFPYNQVSDISPLKNLTNLKSLNFDDNQVSDISPLENLTNLEWLACSNNQVSDISPLENLTNLHQLYFYDNQVSDISPLSNLTNLVYLNFDDNQVTDISVLVENEGTGTNNYFNRIYMENNYLDLTEGSQNMQDIETLINRGVGVYYEPQRNP